MHNHPRTFSLILSSAVLAALALALNANPAPASAQTAATPTASATLTATRPLTATRAVTATAVLAATRTLTPSATATPTGTITATRPTNTPRPTNTRTITPTPVPYNVPLTKAGAVATVNGEIVPWSEFTSVVVLYAPKIEDQLAVIKSAERETFLAQLYKDLLSQLVHEVLLAQAARAAKVSVPENVVTAEARNFLDKTTKTIGAERLQTWLTQADLTDSDWRAAIGRIVERELLINRLTVADDVHSQDEYDAILNRMLDNARIVVNDPSLATAQADLFRGVFPQPNVVFADKASGAPPIYVVSQRDASGKMKTVGYVFYSTDVAPEERGFAGPIKTLIGMDASGTITSIKIVSHREPITRLVDDFLAAPSFIAQFKGKSYRDKFRVGDDLDGIARATVTANAVASAVRTSAQRVAAKYLNAQASAPALSDFLSAFRVPEDSTQRGWLMLLLVLLFVTLIAFWDKGKRFRYGVMVIAILVLGFGKQDFVSVVHLLKLPGAGAPDPYNNLFWYLLAAFTLVTTILFGRIYCGYLCPYGMLTELLGRAMEETRRFFLRRAAITQMSLRAKRSNLGAKSEIASSPSALLAMTEGGGLSRAKLSRLSRAFASFVPYPNKIQIPQPAHRMLILLKYLILVGLIAWVVTGRDVEVYRYFEPFGTLFFFSGDALLWGILIFLLVGGLFVERFYCKYLCPLGAALGVLAFLAPFRIKRIESCNSCKVCAVACPAACIEAKKITMAECYRCGICEDILNRRAGLCRKELGTPVAQPLLWREKPNKV